MAVRFVARLGLEEIESPLGIENAAAGYRRPFKVARRIVVLRGGARMKQLSTLARATGILLLLVTGNRARAADTTVRHSLESDYGFMIGRWTCHVTEAGAADRDIRVEYEWDYDKHVLRESMRLGGKLIGEFLTTYDKAGDRFKGVGVGAWGYVVWENAGFHEGRLTERGFTFDSGKMTPVSRSEFERISDTHYVVHDFDAGGKATDTEDCSKVK
jgi:hypothetical protein